MVLDSMLDVKNPYGEREFAVNLRVQAIYNKYETCSDVKDWFERTLKDVAENNKSGEYLHYLLLVIEYQLKQERSNDAPFTIDANGILERVRNNILNNKDIFMRKSSANPNGFISCFQNHNTTLEVNYGYRIL